MSDVNGLIELGKAGTSVVGAAAAKKFGESAVTEVINWVKEKFRGHNSNVIKKAEENANSFLEKAERYVNIQVTNSDNSPVTIQLIDERFNDPHFSATLHEATIAAAKTDSQEKHDILARLISERITAHREDLKSLIIPNAIDAVSKLNSKHLNFLAFVCLVQYVRPAKIPEFLAINDQSVFIEDWWAARLDVIFKNWETMSKFDYSHLSSVSCIERNTLIAEELRPLLLSKTKPWDVDEFLKATKEGKELILKFEQIQGITLTSTGLLLGAIVLDKIADTNTEIDW